MTQKNRTPPHLRTLLQQSRHYHASALLCGPRPVDIDKLCVSQADRILIFDLPNPADRQHIAQHAGIDPATFEEGWQETRRRGDYWFLMYVADEHELYLCPPLPREWLEVPRAESSTPA